MARPEARNWVVLFTLAWLPVACQSGPFCTFGSPEMMAVEIDDRPVYVDPRSVSIADGELMIAGALNHVWIGDEPDSGTLFGVVVDQQGRSRPVRPPFIFHLSGARAAPAPTAGWRAVFARMDSMAPDRPYGKPDRLWTGVWDGEWEDVRPLSLSSMGYQIDGFDPGDAALLQFASGTVLFLNVFAAGNRMVAIPLDSTSAEVRELSSTTVMWVTTVAGPTPPALVYVRLVPAESKYELVEERGPMVTGGSRRALHQWDPPLTLSGLQAARNDSTLVVLAHEPEPTLYVATGSLPAVRRWKSRGTGRLS